MPIYFLHIPKTGGSVLHHALTKIGNPNLIKCDHDRRFHITGLDDRFVFFVRSPITRFVSAFLCRLGEGKPLYDHPHTLEERCTYLRYKTPEELALDLYLPNGQMNTSAVEALNGVFHLRVSLHYYIQSMANLMHNTNRIFYVGRTEYLDHDYQKLMNKLGIKAPSLTKDPVLSNQLPKEFKAFTTLSQRAKDNIMRYYIEDYRLIKQLKTMGLLSKDYLSNEFSRLRELGL